MDDLDQLDFIIDKVGCIIEIKNQQCTLQDVFDGLIMEDIHILYRICGKINEGQVEQKDIDKVILIITSIAHAENYPQREVYSTDKLKQLISRFLICISMWVHVINGEMCIINRDEKPLMLTKETGTKLQYTARAVMKFSKEKNT